MERPYPQPDGGGRMRKSQLFVDPVHSERMGYAMRAARTLIGHSQEMVADAIGVDLKTIQRMEAGRGHNPNLATLIAVADLYGMQLDVLTGRREFVLPKRLTPRAVPAICNTAGHVRPQRSHDLQSRALEIAAKAKTTKS